MLPLLLENNDNLGKAFSICACSSVESFVILLTCRGLLLFTERNKHMRWGKTNMIDINNEPLLM